MLIPPSRRALASIQRTAVSPADEVTADYSQLAVQRNDKGGPTIP